jgi:hypothetical protein
MKLMCSWSLAACGVKFIYRTSAPRKRLHMAKRVRKDLSTSNTKAESSLKW